MNRSLVAVDGYEYFLFPLNYMNMSQDENGGYSHLGTVNMDFIGWDENGRVYLCPYYAPCECRCVAKGVNGDWVAFNSTNKVHLADGSLDYVSWLQVHDNTPCNIGDTFLQGELIGRTGTRGNVTGDHLHFNVARGHYAGWQVMSSGQSQLYNSLHIYESCFIDYTTVINGGSHTWIESGQEPHPPTPSTNTRRKKFNFILFNRRRGIYG